MVKRDIVIDAIKGLGIILVILSHTANIEYGNYLYAGYIPLFFLTSGFTIKNAFNKNDFKIKVKRLLIPYFIWGTFFTILHLLLSRSQNYLGEFLGLLYSRFKLYDGDLSYNIYMLPMKTISPLWFLTCMFIAFILYWIYDSFKHNISKIICIFYYLLLTYIFQYLPILLPWSIDTAFIACIFIITGKQLKNININIFSFTLILFLYIFLVHINGNINMSIRIYGDNKTYSFILFYFIGILYVNIFKYIFTIFKQSIITKTMSFIGKFSLRIMIFHMPINTLLSFIIIDKTLVVIFTIITSIIFSYIFQKVIDLFDNNNILKYL